MRGLVDVSGCCEVCHSADEYAPIVLGPCRAPFRMAKRRWYAVESRSSVLSGDRLEALYVVAITAGLRQGELLGLKWEDINLEAGTL